MTNSCQELLEARVLNADLVFDSPVVEYVPAERKRCEKTGDTVRIEVEALREAWSPRKKEFIVYVCLRFNYLIVNRKLRGSTDHSFNYFEDDPSMNCSLNSS